MEDLSLSPKNNINKSSSKEEDLISENEIEFQFSRSSGKGGQNVNKVETKVEIHWNINNSKAFSEEEKEKIKEALASRINQGGDLIIVSQEERSQLQNKMIALERLNSLVKEVLKEEKERVLSKPPKSAKEKRLKEKKFISEKKKTRQKNLRIDPSLEKDKFIS